MTKSMTDVLYCIQNLYQVLRKIFENKILQPKSSQFFDENVELSEYESHDIHPRYERSITMFGYSSENNE